MLLTTSSPCDPLRPVHRVIQNHFAAGNNVGAVAAKDEVWEVVAQLTGYAASISVLQNLQGAGEWGCQGYEVMMLRCHPGLESRGTISVCYRPYCRHSVKRVP